MEMWRLEILDCIIGFDGLGQAASNDGNTGKKDTEDRESSYAKTSFIHRLFQLILYRMVNWY